MPAVAQVRRAFRELCSCKRISAIPSFIKPQLATLKAKAPSTWWGWTATFGSATFDAVMRPKHLS